MFTFIIYLTDDFKGGCTTFYENGNTRFPVPLTPVRGSSLIFPHGVNPGSPLHEGSVCEEGVKYVLRSDIMYRRVQEEEQS